MAGRLLLAYHAYSYYPDFIRWRSGTTNRPRNRNVQVVYFRQLCAYHAGIPLMIAEFGVPSSRGIAHRGPLGEDQGKHTEAEQGTIDANC